MLLLRVMKSFSYISGYSICYFTEVKCLVLNQVIKPRVSWKQKYGLINLKTHQH